jgi:integrase
MARRENGTGNVYQRADGLWIGRIDAGFTANGKRRRATVSAKTEAQAKRKLRELAQRLDAGGQVGADARMTVKRYAEEWLARKATRLRPKAYNAAASPMRRWIIPTIGHRRLTELTPAHVRAVERAQREAGRKGSTAAATQRVLMNMLTDAEREGYTIARSVLVAEKPTTLPSDRAAIPREDLRKVLDEAGKDPSGVRWLLAVLYGWRQGEVLGLTREAFDFDNGLVWLDWQLQALPYRDRANKRLGFRVPDDYESKRLVDSWHLVRPKSKAGRRSAPIPQELVEWLRAHVGAVDNRYGLLFPAPDGRPRNDKQDRREWWALQEAAGVAHPSGRPYHVHECRNVAASRLREVGADDLAVTALMGHTSINTSRLYMRVEDRGQRGAIEAAYSGLRASGDD